MYWNYTDFQKWITLGCQKDIAKTVHTLDLLQMMSLARWI